MVKLLPYDLMVTKQPFTMQGQAVCNRSNVIRLFSRTPHLQELRARVALYIDEEEGTSQLNIAPFFFILPSLLR